MENGKCVGVEKISETVKKRVLIFYDHFYPAYKAGGPVQSLVNLVRAFDGAYDFYVVCKPHEMNEREMLSGIKMNVWTDWEGKARVYYRDYRGGNQNELKELLRSVNPDVIFINGLFSLHFTIRPLQSAVAYCKEHAGCRLILSARGMLHPGALSQKSLKKKLFLFFFQLAGWQKAVVWHATDEQEKQYIQQQFGLHTKVEVAGNFPNLLPVAEMPEKKEQKLVMGTVALISPMKNHLAVLQALQNSVASIRWHIYGPVKDAVYWKKCGDLIKVLPPAVEVVYHGELSPVDLPAAMDQFQLFIMPSKSENFGHALLEALSAGKPVITTDTTPFKGLQEARAGYTVTINQLAGQLTAAIAGFAAMGPAEFAACSKAASVYASHFVDEGLLRQQYERLFLG